MGFLPDLDKDGFIIEKKVSVVNNRKRRNKRRKFKKQKKVIYRQYIKSRRWNKRRRRYFAQIGNRCAVCNTNKNINLHHKTYKNLGNELDEDLIVLCETHHEQFHDMYGVQSHMVEQTDAFVESAKYEDGVAQIFKNL